MKHAGIKQARRGKAVAQRVSAPKTPKQLPSLEEFRRGMGRPGTPAAQLLREERGKTKAIRKLVPQGRARPAKKTPAYEPDDGPLTAKQIEAIKKLVPQGRVRSVKSSLF